MKKVERLSVAAAVAPVLRGQAEAVKKRRIYLTSPGGEVTGVTTNEELQASMLLRARIEFDVSEGVRETHRDCALCGKPFAIEGKSNNIRTCDGCRTRQTKCAGDGCEAVPPRLAATAREVAKRKGRPWMCAACRYKDPEYRAKVAEAARRKAQDPEYRAKHAEAARRKAQDPEYRAKQAENLRRAREAKRAKNEQRPGAASTTEGERE